MCDEEREAWMEYHVDFMPDELRAGFNGGIGGYVSQRRLCQRLRPNAPRHDDKLLPLLCDLLVVSTPQLHELLRRDLDLLTLGREVRKEFFHNQKSLGIYTGEIKRRFDDTNNYRVLYSDGDVEDYTFAELFPLLTATDFDKRQIKTAHDDIVAVLQMAKNKPESQRYFYRKKLVKKSQENPAWFGTTLHDRRKLSVSLFNFCLFRHPVGSCTCDEGVDPWARSTESKPCVFRHEPEVCKCNQIAIKFSQDECSYAAYLLSKKEWRVGGTHHPRKKRDGPPLHVSEYASFEFGHGIKVNDAQLARINRLRMEGDKYYSEVQDDGQRREKAPLAYYPEADSITVHCMMPGENKDG